MNDTSAHIKRLLIFLYGEEEAERVLPELKALMDSYRGKIPALSRREYLPDERDAILITYGDQFRAPEPPPNAAGAYGHLEGASARASPRFPTPPTTVFQSSTTAWTELGDWNNSPLGERYRLMLDFVASHSTTEHWFASFLRKGALHGLFHHPKRISRGWCGRAALLTRLRRPKANGASGRPSAPTRSI